jgi:hypothetical protein
VSDTALPDPRLRRDARGEVFAMGRVLGHPLRCFGQAFLASDCYIGRCATNIGHTVHQENGPAFDSVRGAGHAVCRCGVLSPHLGNGAARKRWHRAHKARVLLHQPEPPGQPAPVNPATVA